MISQILLLPQVVTPYTKYVVVYKFFKINAPAYFYCILSIIQLVLTLKLIKANFFLFNIQRLLNNHNIYYLILFIISL